MDIQDWRNLAIIASLFAGLIALGLLVWRRWLRRRRLAQGPDWQLMLDDMEYFKQAVWRVLLARGYDVEWARVFIDPITHQPNEVVFALHHHGELVAALCGRWLFPITSEIITHFEAALATTQARHGLIITTSYFTDAAKEAARHHPVELVDGRHLAAWIKDIYA